jgi:hypothetical protein
LIARLPFVHRKSNQPQPAASIAAAQAAKAPEVVTINKFVTRLSPEVYDKFESNLQAPVIDRQATDAGCDAAYKLGMQFVLKKLRTELVVE